MKLIIEKEYREISEIFMTMNNNSSSKQVIEWSGSKGLHNCNKVFLRKKIIILMKKIIILMKKIIILMKKIKHNTVLEAKKIVPFELTARLLLQ